MKLKAAIAAGALALAPIAASAVTIDGAGASSGSATLNFGDVGSFASFEFTNSDTRDLLVEFSFSGSGLTADLGSITYELMYGGNTFGLETYDSVANGAALTQRGADFGTIRLGSGETALITFFDPDPSPGPGVTTTAFYAPIPIPAAGWMLVSAIAGIGILGRRRARA